MYDVEIVLAGTQGKKSLVCAMAMLQKGREYVEKARNQVEKLKDAQSCAYKVKTTANAIKRISETDPDYKKVLEQWTAMPYDVSAYDDPTLEQIVELHPEAIAEASQSVCVGFAVEGFKLLRAIIDQAGDKEVLVETLISRHEQKDPWEKYVTTGQEMLQKDVAWLPDAVSTRTSSRPLRTSWQSWRVRRR